ncbi:MAG: hypothetical protein R3E10_04895 [Gemmatimonadota bacterium]
MVTRRGTVWGVALAAWALAAGPLEAQRPDLSEFDYENLSFRGIGIDVGFLAPNRVESAFSVGGRVDLGYLGPSFRIVPHASYWSSDFKTGEVRELEDQVQALIEQELPAGTPAPTVNLGSITWSDLAVGLDGHFVWAIPSLGVLSLAGVGATAHFLNGSGAAIEGTFVEDLLDSWTVGLNAHGGLEVPMSERMRVYGIARYNLLEDLRAFEFRLGAQVMFGEPLPGERTR